MDDYVVIAFYTINTPYEDEVKKLEADLKELDIPYDIHGYPSRSKWEFNCGIKPEFVRDMMKKHKKTVMYIDVDARIYARPLLASGFKHDFSCYHKQEELLSGTLIFGYTDTARELVDAWVIEQRDNPTVWDQRTLSNVYKRFTSKLDFLTLPAEYIKIFDTMSFVERPIIEHFQASRKYKTNLVIKGEMMIEVPANLKVNVRYAKDGTFWMPRNNREAEKYFDKNYIRYPGELRWWPITIDDNAVNKFKNCAAGKVGYLVGKGPSLDKLTADDFQTDGPIIGLNEAFKIVEELDCSNPKFGTQQDTWMGPTMAPKSEGTLFVSPRAWKIYEQKQDNIVQINPVMFARSMTPPSHAIGIGLLKMMNVTKIVFLCFDACVNGITEYAKCVGYDPKNMGDPKRFLNHKNDIERYLQGFPCEWVIPTGQSSCELTSSYIPSQSSDNPELHHEPDHEPPQLCSQENSENTSRKGKVHLQRMSDRLDIQQQS
jgi:hypothetical protein